MHINWHFSAVLPFFIQYYYCLRETTELKNFFLFHGRRLLPRFDGRCSDRRNLLFPAFC